METLDFLSVILGVWILVGKYNIINKFKK